MVPTNTDALSPRFTLKPKSKLYSPHVVVYESAEIKGALSGCFVIIFMSPPTASLPYNDEVGPFTISILSINEFGMPESP